MTRTRRAAGAASLVLALVSDNEAREQRPITGDTAAAVQAWVDAVRSHVPGRADEPVMVVAAYSYETREELDAGLGFFLAALLGRQYDTKNNPAARTIVGIGRSAGSPDDVSFLKRAAVFHADVAAYGERAPAPSAAGTKAPAGRETAPVSPLLTKNRLVLTKDGQVLGEMPASWNWPFARSLLERLARQRDGTSRDPFVALWYHATSAHMFDSGAYGDLTPHLEDAGTVLRDDPWMLFDRGCYAELLGLPLLQAVLPDSHVMDEKLRRDRAAGGMSTWRTPASSASLGIPPANETNNEAERLFRRAVTLDPSLDEARVRLARLLILRSRHKEALAELTTALTGNPPPIVAYYGHLFSGRAAQALAQTDEASRHYLDALARYPHAQSALLASSQLALLGLDIPAALATIERLGDDTAEFTADPWWQYHLCAGRDAEALMQSLWAAVAR